MNFSNFRVNGWSPMASRLAGGGLLLVVLAFGANFGWRLNAAVDAVPPSPNPAAGQESGGDQLAAELPDDLASELFESLGKNWQSWSQETQQVLGGFYSSLRKSPAEQSAAISALQARQDTVEKALRSSEYSMIHGPLAELRGALELRLELARARIATLALPTRTIVPQPAPVQQKIAELQSTLTTYRGGDAWNGYLGIPTLQSSLSGPQAADAAKQTLVKIASRETMPDEAQRNFLNQPAFSNLEKTLKSFLDDAEQQRRAAEGENPLTGALNELTEAVDSYVSDRTMESTTAVRASFDRVRKLAGDGGEAVALVLRRHLLNYNLRICATEEFLNRFLSDSKSEQGPVCDCILGASVSGWQHTNSTVRLDLKPSPSDIRFALAVQGNVVSNTAGNKHPATVYTSGNHQFWGSKDVWFNGDQFQTGRASVSVQPCSVTTGASSNINIPIIRRIIQKVALRKAEELRPQADAITAQRITSQIEPRFNSEVDSRFSQAGSQLDRELFSGLRSTGLMPDVRVHTSTEDRLWIYTRLMGAAELGGGTLPPNFAAGPAEGAALYLHETTLNNATDRFELAGQVFAESELKTHMRKKLSQAFGRPINFLNDTPAKSPVPAPAAPNADPVAYQEDEEAADDERFFAFADEDPVRFAVENGQLTLSLKMSFLKERDEERKKPFVVNVPVSFVVQPTSIDLKWGEVEVIGPGRARAKSKIEKKLAQLKNSSSNQFPLQAGSRTVTATVERIQMSDGWVAIGVR